MSFSNILKRAFGFGGSADDDFDDAMPAVEADDEVADSCPPPSVEPQSEPIESQPVAAASDSLPVDVFDTLLEVFNSSQPPIIRECIDIEAQRRFMRSRFDSAFKDYLARMHDDARRTADNRVAHERESMRDTIEDLKARCREHESQAEAWEESKLSAKRQKRAVDDRVKELEKQLASALGDCDGMRLENKELQNKLKVASVKLADAASLSDEVAALKEQLAEPRNDDAGLRQSLEAEIASLKHDVATSAVAHEAEMSQLAETLKNERKKALDSLRRDHKNRVVALETEIAELKERVTSLNAKDAFKDAQLERSASELASYKAKLDAAASVEAALKADLDARDIEINSLKADLEAREARVALLESEISSLKTLPATDVAIAVDAPAADYSPAPAAVADESVTTDAPKPAGKPRRRKKKVKQPISAIDDSLDSTNWLVPTPPEGVDARVAAAPDVPFGYQEPPRRQVPENEAQMTLF